MNNRKRILVATKNEGKFHEIEAILKDLPIRLFHLHSKGLTDKNGEPLDRILENDDFEEHGKTFEENAILKATHYAQITGMSTIGEDSGILIDALQGELGVKTRRWGAGAHATDQEWIDHFMNVMKDIPLDKRNAKFMCASAFVNNFHDGEITVFHGETKGVITEKLEAPLTKGIPLSSCFRPKDHEKVFANLTDEQKSQVSHRGKAVRQLKEFIKQHL